MMQQRSTEQRSTVDSRHRLTNFKIAINVNLTTTECSNCRQEYVNSLLWMLSKSVIFLDFRFSQGSVATYCR